MNNMVATLTPLERTTPENDEPELHVVAFYEDLSRGELAKELIDRIRSRVPRDTHTTPGLWRFDVLQHEHLARSAASDAADAGVIIVAAQGGYPLPRRVLDCIETALARKRLERVGLVAILEGFDQIANETLPVYRQLQAICRNAKLRFFCLPSPNLSPTPSLSDNFRFGQSRLLDNSLSIEIHSYRGWGIND